MKCLQGLKIRNLSEPEEVLLFGVLCFLKMGTDAAKRGLIALEAFPPGLVSRVGPFVKDFSEDIREVDAAYSTLRLKIQNGGFRGMIPEVR